MDHHQGHRKGPDHRNHLGTTNRPTLNNSHGTQLNRIATINLTTTRATTIMADTEGTKTTTITTTTRDTVETTTTTTTTAADRLRRTISNSRILKAECMG